MTETPSKVDEYRETAAKLRQMAEGTKSREAWLEIINLAERFERLAARAEKRIV